MVMNEVRRKTCTSSFSHAGVLERSLASRKKEIRALPFHSTMYFLVFQLIKYRVLHLPNYIISRTLRTNTYGIGHEDIVDSEWIHLEPVKEKRT